jgi:hypothetical protein
MYDSKLLENYIRKLDNIVGGISESGAIISRESDSIVQTITYQLKVSADGELKITATVVLYPDNEVTQYSVMLNGSCLTEVKGYSIGSKPPIYSNRTYDDLAYLSIPFLLANRALFLINFKSNINADTNPYLYALNKFNEGKSDFCSIREEQNHIVFSHQLERLDTEVEFIDWYFSLEGQFFQMNRRITDKEPFKNIESFVENGVIHEHKVFFFHENTL